MSLLGQKGMTFNGAFSGNAQIHAANTFNKTQIHRAVMPSANGITNARSLARIYALLIGDINENGQQKQRLLSEKTLSQTTTNVTPAGEPDLVLFGIKSRFAKGGFHVYSDYFKAFGNTVFGHKGNLY